jgi:carboxypeptidase Q
MAARIIAVFFFALSMTGNGVLAQSSLPVESLERVEELIRLALVDRTGYTMVESLTTEVGPRLAGSEAEQRARLWALKKLKVLGFDNVRVEEFSLPLWQRGTERVEIISPFPQQLSVTALGGSESTGPNGIEGEVVSFDSLAALAAQPEQSLVGKIVFIDEVMTRTQDGSGYGVAAKKRRETAYEAHRVGAHGALIRSAGTSSHRFPHTGQMHRAGDEYAPSVPTAALAAPDADQLSRALTRATPIVLRIVLETQLTPNATSGNVIAEIVGREHPEQIVLLGAHLDSWDLGTGAVDDGAGVGIVVGAAKLLLDSLPDGPKRTIRIVLFGAEEVGVIGAQAYAKAHAAELNNHVVAAESDFGAGKIWRFDTRVGEQKLTAVHAIAGALSPLGIAGGSNEARGGPDLYFLREAGVPVVSLVQNGWDYFDLHHTANDTFDKIDADKLAQNVAAYAVFAYLASEMEGNFR